LAKKQLGGSINQRGNDYEIAFACFRIIQLMNDYPNYLHRIAISSQTPAFVDDLVTKIDIPGSERDLYYQLKTSQKLSWGRGIGSLNFDFYQQGFKLKKDSRVFHLYLVISNCGLFHQMKKKMPPRLRKTTTVTEFSWFGSLHLQCTMYQNFRIAVVKLCAFPDTDKIIALVGCIYANWGLSDKKNVLLSQILNGVRSLGYSYLKSNIPMLLKNETTAILNQIPGFQFEIVYGYFSWTYSTTDKGQIPYLIDSAEFRTIENEIILRVPMTFDELEPIIS
jgi:hypothetical protein